MSNYQYCSLQAQEELSPAPLAALRERGDEVLKRGMDLGGSAALLAALLPLMGVIAILVKATSRGPVLFKQRRLGRHGREFWCYKFRSMVPDAEALLAQRADLRAQFVANYKLKADPRVTRFGGFLRRSSLDELPQLWNVLRGEMSLIGPRPIVALELGKYGVHADRLLQVKPGLGGIWQVSGRSDISYDERVVMDMTYVDSRSIWLDLKLILLTALVVVKGRGAC